MSYMSKYTFILINKKVVGHVLVIFEQVKEECKLIFISDQVKEQFCFINWKDAILFYMYDQVKEVLNLVLFISVQGKRVMNRAIRMLMCTSCILSPQVVSIIETQAQHNASDFEVL